MNFILHSFLFLSFISAIFVVISRNPIHSIMFFVLVVCNISGYLFFIHVEFLALIFLVVYVGAISILFLFVVMMLNIRILEISNKLLNYFSVNSLVITLLLLEVGVILFSLDFHGGFILSSIEPALLEWIILINSSSNIILIGQILYLYYFDLFLIAGFILLVSMIASIILTLEYKIEIRNPNIYEQILSKTSLKLIK